MFSYINQKTKKQGGEPMRKWEKITELIDFIEKDDTLDNCAKHLKSLGRAPSVSYRGWFFKYKGELVVLFDAGNGHYRFISSASYIDVLISRITEFKMTRDYIKAEKAKS